MNQQKVYIITEGNDFKFLEAFIAKHYSHKTINIDYFLNKCGGYTNLSSVRQHLQRNTKARGINILVFDADTTGIANGGVSDRKIYLHEQAKRSDIIIDDIFLFPNNEEDGEYETLLEAIVPDTHQQVIDEYKFFEKSLIKRWFPYSSRLSTKSNYQTPDKKTLIYTYTHILKFSYAKLLREDKINKNKEILQPDGKELCFKDPDFWNLEHRALDPLKSFLDQYL